MQRACKRDVRVSFVSAEARYAVAAVSRRVTASFVDSLSTASGHIFEAEVEGAD